MDEDTKREIIMDNYLQPMNKESVNDLSYEKINTSNSSCIDNLDIYVKVENNVIKDIKFQGEACAISTSSTSIMIHNLIGLTVDEGIQYIDNFNAMINEKPYDASLLKEGIVYDEIYKQSNRKNCAYLPYRGVKEILCRYVKKSS